jgi:general secretion pathway protein M
MSASLPTGRRGRLLALGVTATALLSLWFGAAAPIIAWYDDRAAEIAQRQSLARRMVTLVQSVPELEQRARASTETALPANALLEGSSDAIAGATLQDLVQRSAEKVKATLTSAETLAAEQAGSYRRIGVRVALGAIEWPTLLRLLQLLEQSRPVMLIDDLQLHAAPNLQMNFAQFRNPVFQPQPPGIQPPQQQQHGPTSPAPIDASFTVIAFRAVSATQADAEHPAGTSPATKPAEQ